MELDAALNNYKMTNILEIGLKILETLAATSIGAYTAIKVAQIQYENKKKKEDTFDLHDNTTPEIKALCKYIVDYTGAIRSDFWIGHNGVKTKSGFHMRKLAMLTEVVTEKTSATMHLYNESIPANTFERNMIALQNSDKGYIISFESEVRDELATFIRSYGVNTFVAFKVYTDAGDWEALFTLGFAEEKRELTEKEVARIRVLVNKMGSLISNSK